LHEALLSSNLSLTAWLQFSSSFRTRCIPKHSIELVKVFFFLYYRVPSFYSFRYYLEVVPPLLNSCNAPPSVSRIVFTPWCRSHLFIVDKFFPLRRHISLPLTWLSPEAPVLLRFPLPTFWSTGLFPPSRCVHDSPLGDPSSFYP